MSVLDSRTLSRVERHKQATRQRLKHAIDALLQEVGYHRLTIKAITERADLGYGTFYMHFADKDEAVWEVLREYGDALRADMDARLLQIPFPRREYLSWVELFQFAALNRENFVAIFGKNGSSKLYRLYQDYLIAIHTDSMTHGRYSADLASVPTEFLAQFIVGALLRLLLWWLETPNNYTPHDMARMMFMSVYRQPPPE